METYAQCQLCGKELKGRRGKKFCDHKCRSAFQYQQFQKETPMIYYDIDRQLKKNRRILKSFNKSGKSVVRKETLIESGFNPKYFTHYWKNNKGDVYLFCYEYGYLAKKEKGVDKYVLVQHSGYMG